MSRKRITPDERQIVYNKYQGHCAYCGCELKFKDMQVDHLIPVRNWDNSHTDEELNDISNLMPSCRQCNKYKDSYTLEHFRQAIEQIPFKLNRDNTIYRIGVKYGNIIPNEKPIVFYFENQSNTEMIPLGITIKQYRNRAKITQKMLADLSGINHSLIKKYELNAVLPKFENYYKIMKALSVDEEIIKNTYFNYIISSINK